MNTPRIVRRSVDPLVRDAARDEGFSEPIARILGSRLPPASVARAGGVRRLVAPTLAKMDPPDRLPDLDLAAERIERAITTREQVAIVVDHDCDGCTSAAIIWSALTEHLGVDPRRVHLVTTHRLSEGYGVTVKAAARVLALEPRPTLVITADQGSSCRDGVAALAPFCDVVVTDHHLVPPEGVPPAAYAVVNPAIPGSAFPDPAIAGCHVAWYVMAAVRRRLIANGRLPASSPSLANLLDLVALGEVADCISLSASHNARAAVRHGLNLIRAGKRPCWAALAGTARVDLARASSETLAFAFGPRANAVGRLDAAMPTVHTLLAKNAADAAAWAQVLEEGNDERKRIERALREQALNLAEKQVSAGRMGLVVHLVDGNPGVHGIVASRLVERFGRPALCLSPRAEEPWTLAGSARSIPEIHLRDVLQRIQSELAPGVFSKMGGHRAACGCTVGLADVARLTDAFDRAVRDCVAPETFGQRLLVEADGQPPLDLEQLAELDELEPFGREFERPRYLINARVRRAQPMGDGTHLRLELELASGARPLRAVWFGARPNSDAAPPQISPDASFVVSMSRNDYKGHSTLQAEIHAMVVSREAGAHPSSGAC